jgi:hypothetical protein
VISPRPSLVALVLLAAVAVVATAAGVSAQSAGPTITLDNNLESGQVQAGERVTVTFDGFEARSAMLSVCGNRAARGSGDCNMVESQGVRLRHMDVTLTHDMTVTIPPFPCPCVIRAVGVETGEVAVTPIDLVGHPIADVVEPDLGQPLIDVSLSTTGASNGPVSWLRQSLGGPSPQLATISVKNLTTGVLSGAAVRGSVTRSGVSVAEFDLDTGEIGPGQTWTGTTEVEIPAPAIGTYEWTVTSSGVGPVVTSETSSRSVPWLLVILVLMLVWDLTAMVVRRIQRRRAREKALSVARPVDPELVIDIRDHGVVDRATPLAPDDPTLAHEPVGAGSGRGQGAP